jgi:hypothetical protein
MQITAMRQCAIDAIILSLTLALLTTFFMLLGSLGLFHHLLVFLLILIYPLTIILIILFYKRYSKVRNTYAVPLCFVFFPFLVYFMLAGSRLFFDSIIRTGAGGWEILAGVAVPFYSLPFLIITGIVSHGIESKKRN